MHIYIFNVLSAMQRKVIIFFWGTVFVSKAI